MKLEEIKFYFDAQEVAALARLLALNPPALLELPEPDMDAARGALAAAQLISGGAGETVVDRVSAFMLSAICKSRVFLCARDAAGRYIGLFDAADASFVLTRGDSRCVIAPFERFDDALACAEETLCLSTPPFLVRMRGIAGAWEGEYADEGFAKTASALAAQLHTKERPVWEGMQPWKP